MKTKIKKISSSLWAMILALLMLVSSFSVMAGTVNITATGAFSFSGTSYMYFDNSTTNWNSSKLYLFIGKDKTDDNWTAVYPMTAVSNTKMCYVKLPSSGWGDATYMCVAETSDKWGDGNWGSSNRTNATHYTNTYTAGLYASNGQTYMFTPSSSSNNCSIALGGSYSSYTAFNKTTNMYSSSRTSSTGSYSNNNTGGYVTASYRYMSGLSTTTVVSDTNTNNTNGTASLQAALSSEVTLAATEKSGYKFDGWYSTATGGTALSTDLVYKYVQPNSKTVYARFTKNTVPHNVSWTNPANGTIKVNNSATSPVSVNESSTYTVTLTPDTGYELDTFTVGGVDKKSSVSNNKYTGTMGTSDVTIAATFEKKQYTVKAGTPVGGTVQFADGDSQKTITHGYSDIVQATPATGYEFSRWKDVDGIEFTTPDDPTSGITVTADATFEAIFTPKTYNVRVADNILNGTVTVSPTGTAKYGSTVTVTATPNSGYVLKAITVMGDDGATTGQTVTVTGNKFTMPAFDVVVSAEFEEKKVDYSKYKLIGKFDSDKWTYDKGIQFDSNGEATFTISHTNDGNGQFRINDGNTNYGVGGTLNQEVTLNTKEYTTKAGNSYIYYIGSRDGAGTYTVKITDIASDGSPTFKVIKASGYKLMNSTTQISAGTLIGNFMPTDTDNVYEQTITVNAGTYYFYVLDGNNKHYCQGNKTGTLGEEVRLYGYDNVSDKYENIEYQLSAGTYKVTYKYVAFKETYLTIFTAAKPLADSVTLTTNKTSVSTSKSATLTATVNGTKLTDGDSYTYTLYDGSTQLAQRTTTSTTQSFNVTSDTVGTKNYKVVVSTNAAYVDGTNTVTYASVTSNDVSVYFVEASIFYAYVDENGNIGPRQALANNSFKATGKDVTVAFFSDEEEISDESIYNLNIDSSRNKYTTITNSTVENENVSGGIPTYRIVCNSSDASAPTVYVSGSKLYAVSTLSGITSKTFDSKETVDYYFAEPTDNINWSKSGNGLRIKYWNNSVEGTDNYVDVTTPVGKDGPVASTGSANTITVNIGDLYNTSATQTTGTKQFYVYKVSLPIWATSFQFVSSGTTGIATNNGVVNNNAIASMGLNPNRIYLLYGNNSTDIARGVVLDSSFWTETSRSNNNVKTKNFKANAVNYNTSYSGASINNNFNNDLNKLYSSTYKNPLFFGYLDPNTTNFQGNSNFRIQDNLAMRWDDNRAYYASVQGLAGNTLSSTSKNENGYSYLLTSDGSANMPLFDYAALKNNSAVASNVFEKLNFPFYESNHNGITTYSYDSYTDKNRAINTSTNDFEVDTYSNATLGDDKGVGFFPFDKFDSTNNKNKYGSGTEFDIDFYMSDTGKLTATNGDEKDITFNFSGDDDVWVYVDGVLVLDLGGSHKASSGSINFSQMKVYYKAAVDSSDAIQSRDASPKTSDKFATDRNYVTTVDLKKLFAANGVDFNNTNTSKKHSLQMFYMERGSLDSNCSISFNLPQNSDLLVRNDVNFDSVNPGLVDITKGVANKDYFSYSIANRLATAAEYNTIKAAFGSALASNPTSFGSSDAAFISDKPLYPIVTNDNIIRRVVNGETYYLAVKNTAGAHSNYYWNKLNTSTYTPLTGINYNLPDDFAKVESGAEGVSTAVSGKVTNGDFKLLFNQSASFNSKVPSNTLLRIVQNDTLYDVNAGNSTTAMSVGNAKTGRSVKDYYTTAYTITGDKSNKEIGKRERQVNTGDITADGTSSIEDAFYFADYSGEASDSCAMTVNFTNYVTTDKIKISKKLTDGTEANNDRFTFVVKLSNIFGDASNAEAEYENLTYEVYEADTNTLKGTRTYGKSGVSITANEYAIITGVPVGTKYSVQEKTRTGYQFNNVTADFVTDSNANGNEFAPEISASTVSGTMPTITQSGATTEPTLNIVYTNEKVAFTIRFKYYDREVKTGEVAHINTTPTVVNYAIKDISKYILSGSEETEDVVYDFKQMITDAVTASGIDPDNVIDSYNCYTSQADAVAGSGIKSKPSYRDFDTTTSKYKTYSEAYGANANYSNHTDCYGRLQGSTGAVTNDGEDWVTYFNGNTKVTESDATKPGAAVSSITVWFYNTLKTYQPTFHYATQFSELDKLGNGKYLGTETNTITPVFYNVRLGISNGDQNIDGQGEYLKEYGVTGYTNSYSGTALTIQNGDQELQFLYWSYDKEGKSIASNSYKYGYRITNSIHLYAIYGKERENTEPGLTVSMNSPDYYVDSAGVQRVRLNTMMNVYNCPDSDPMIRQTAVIYLQDPNNYIGQYIANNNEIALDTIRDKVKELISAHSDEAQFSGITISIDGTNDNQAKGLTYKVWSDDGTSLLTNKNRMQFTTSFKQASLGGENYKNLYTFAAMNYKETDDATDNWLVSDNYIKYTFDEKGKVTNELTQVNSLQ